MAFVDEITFVAEAGQGGDGVVRWRQEKFVPKGGPAGGDGGRGGNFYVCAVRDIGILLRHKPVKHFAAGRGEDGGAKSLHGRAGKDLVLELPIGSVVTNLDTEERWELLEDGQKILLLRGGYGGFGNEHFKSSTNTTPREWRPGAPGEKSKFHVELELFADLGLVGLPNAGKSSLLNALTEAHAKVGDYPFTTLDPNLGNFFGYIIADIPGLIEGASAGRGLGTKFLRHIKRTRALAHLVSFEYGEAMMKKYEEVREELRRYGQGLNEKEEIIILTKSDVADAKTIKTETARFKKLKRGKKVFHLSLFDDVLLKKTKDELLNFLRKF
ncbi:MAG: GTPase ObgE [Patescibacteria group bacterium]